MPVPFPPREVLEQNRALGTALSALKALPSGETIDIAAHFLRLPKPQLRSLTKTEIGELLKTYVLQLYNSRAPELTDFETYLDAIARQRLKER